MNDPHHVLTRTALIAVALLTTMAAAQTPPSSQLPLSLHVPVPPAVVATDGLYRLLYELHLENRGDVTVTLSSVEIHTTAPNRESRSMAIG